MLKHKTFWWTMPIDPPLLVHTFFSTPVGASQNRSACRSIKSRLHAPVPAQSAFRFLLSWTTQQVSSLSPGGPILLHILLSICLLEDYDPSVLSIRVNEEPCPPRSWSTAAKRPVRYSYYSTDESIINLLFFLTSLHKNLHTLLGSRLGNSGNVLELRVLTLLHYVPWGN